MNLIKRIMRIFFHLLYHRFAFAYDLVAATVSFGRWNDWTKTVLPFIEGGSILEIGHGPGYLQRILLDLKFDSVAIDESAQMGRIAKRRLGRPSKLTRALAQSIPFAAESFDSVVATFPSEYIFDKQTLSEEQRILRSRGRLIILLAAWPKSPLLAWLFKVTSQSPDSTYKSIKSKTNEFLTRTKFNTLDVEIVEVKSASLLIVIAKK